MTETEKLTLLIKVLKEYAEREHCYEYNRELTAAEIQQNFNATRSRFSI